MSGLLRIDPSGLPVQVCFLSSEIKLNIEAAAFRLFAPRVWNKLT